VVTGEPDDHPFGVPGTPEAEWRAHLARAPLGPGPLPALSRCRRVVVLAAHPDDEVLGAGGLIAGLARAGVPLRVVWATDGEASHGGDDRQRAALGARRRRESAEALRRLGAGAAERRYLRLPDTRVADHESDLAAHLADLVRPGDGLLSPWRQDGHADHDACGRAADAAVGGMGRVVARQFPIWFWHRCAPPAPWVDWASAEAHPLSAADRCRKERAVAAFGSQVGARPEGGPVLPPVTLARAARDREVLFR
jgi:LmbE family N-acetylglucosaminyl deacetylase